MELFKIIILKTTNELSILKIKKKVYFCTTVNKIMLDIDFQFNLKKLYIYIYLNFMELFHFVIATENEDNVFQADAFVRKFIFRSKIIRG